MLKQRITIYPSDALFRYAYLNAYFESGLTNPLDEAITANRQLDIVDVRKLDEIPYDFVRKRLSIVVQSTQPANAVPLLITKARWTISSPSVRI